jgi:hypothetical protein
VTTWLVVLLVTGDLAGMSMSMAECRAIVGRLDEGAALVADVDGLEIDIVWATCREVDDQKPTS